MRKSALWAPVTTTKEADRYGSVQQGGARQRSGEAGRPVPPRLGRAGAQVVLNDRGRPGEGAPEGVSRRGRRGLGPHGAARGGAGPARGPGGRGPRSHGAGHRGGGCGGGQRARHPSPGLPRRPRRLRSRAFRGGKPRGRGVGGHPPPGGPHGLPYGLGREPPGRPGAAGHAGPEVHGEGSRARGRVAPGRLRPDLRGARQRGGSGDSGAPCGPLHGGVRPRPAGVGRRRRASAPGGHLHRLGGRHGGCGPGDRRRRHRLRRDEVPRRSGALSSGARRHRAGPRCQRAAPRGGARRTP